MPSYTSLVVLALVASNVSPALSAPIPKRREQSPSHSGLETRAPVGRAVPWGKYGKEFALGMGATMAFSYVFEKLSGSGSSKAATEATTAAGSTAAGSGAAAESATAASNANYATNPSYSSSPGYSSSSSGYSSSSPSYSSSSSGYSSSSPSYSSSSSGYSSSTPGYSSSSSGYSASPYPTTQTQNGYKRRTVNRDVPVDIFGASEARSTSDDRNHRQTTSPDLSGRADLAAAIRLFSRMLDELD